MQWQFCISQIYYWARWAGCFKLYCFDNTCSIWPIDPHHHLKNSHNWPETRVKRRTSCSSYTDPANKSPHNKFIHRLYCQQSYVYNPIDVCVDVCDSIRKILKFLALAFKSLLFYLWWDTTNHNCSTKWSSPIDRPYSMDFNSVYNIWIEELIIWRRGQS